MKSIIVDIKEISDSREVMEKSAPHSITILISILLAAILIAITWACFGEMDVYSKMHGEIRPENSVQVLSAVDGGKIEELYFKDGDYIESGEMLLSFNQNATLKQQKNIKENIKEINNKIALYQKLKESIEKNKNLFLKSEKELEYYNQYEKYQKDLKASLTQLKDTQTQNDMAKEDALYTLNTIDSDIQKKRNLISLYKQMLVAVEDGHNFKCEDDNVINAQFKNYWTSLEKINTNITKQETTRTNLIKSNEDTEDIELITEQIDALIVEKDSLTSSFVLEITQKINTLESEISTLEVNRKKTNIAIKGYDSGNNEVEIKSQAKIDMMVSIDNTVSRLKDNRTELERQKISIDSTIDNSPVIAENTGNLVFLKELSVGDYLLAGSSIAKIVPKENVFKAVLYVPESGISKIEIGQKVEYIINSLPMSEYGKVTGNIESISADTFYEENTGNKYYKVEASVSTNVLINAKGESREIQTGMIIDARVICGKQKILTWVLEKLNFIND